MGEYQRLAHGWLDVIERMVRARLSIGEVLSAIAQARRELVLMDGDEVDESPWGFLSRLGALRAGLDVDPPTADAQAADAQEADG